jgi:hypothetical protein
VGIPRFLRDSQARWESRFFDSSSARLFHSPLALHFVVAPWLALCVVSAQPVRSVGKTDGSVQMLMHGYAATHQRAAPAHRFDLQAQMLETDGVVAIDASEILLPPLLAGSRFQERPERIRINASIHSCVQESFRGTANSLKSEAESGSHA